MDRSSDPYLEIDTIERVVDALALGGQPATIEVCPPTPFLGHPVWTAYIGLDWVAKKDGQGTDLDVTFCEILNAQQVQMSFGRPALEYLFRVGRVHWRLVTYPENGRGLIGADVFRVPTFPDRADPVDAVPLPRQNGVPSLPAPGAAQQPDRFLGDRVLALTRKGAAYADPKRPESRRLSRDEWRILALLDGKRTLSEVARVWKGAQAEDLLEFLRTLASQGLFAEK